MRTTNVQRTVDSLRCVLAGMFGPNGINGKGNVETIKKKGIVIHKLENQY